MPCRFAAHFSFNTTEAADQKLPKVPATAIRPEEAQVMQMQGTALMRRLDLFGIDFIEPILFGEAFADEIVHPVDRASCVGIFLGLPGRLAQVGVKEGVCRLDEGLALTHPLPLITVQDIGLCRFLCSAGHQGLLDQVQDVLDRDGIDAFHVGKYQRCHFQGIDILICSYCCPVDCIDDFLNLAENHLPVPFDHLLLHGFLLTEYGQSDGAALAHAPVILRDGVSVQARSSGSGSSIPLPSRITPVALSGISPLQRRDRVGFSPTSLFLYTQDIVFSTIRYTTNSRSNNDCCQAE
ncbi:hypothetical protein SDC9_55418 [bioreactor metagenome]|uniref:Uncharacterized protein n=1 Tax=bioreactor metagenome TaxID=1076179 RepID=A0A644WZ42_9ZZZZ